MSWPYVPTEQRVWAKIAQGPDCWTWMGAHNSRRRAVISVDRKLCYVARLLLSWQLGRELTKGEYACHTCDNPPCVNPAHLFAGTARANTHDMIEKGRSNWRTTALPAEIIHDRARTFTVGRSKERCRLGHLRAGDNLYVSPTGRRACRTCRTMRTEESSRRHR